MKRISTGLNNSDVQYRLRLHESKLNHANNQLGSQRRLQQLRDDPIAAGHLVRYQSFKGRIDTFETNAQTLTEKFTIQGSCSALRQVKCKKNQPDCSHCHFCVNPRQKSELKGEKEHTGQKDQKQHSFIPLISIQRPSMSFLQFQ